MQPRPTTGTAWSAGLQTGTRGAPSRAQHNFTRARWRWRMLLRHPCVRQRLVRPPEAARADLKAGCYVNAAPPDDGDGLERRSPDRHARRSEPRTAQLHPGQMALADAVTPSMRAAVIRSPARGGRCRPEGRLLCKGSPARRRGRLGAPVSDRHRPPPAGEHVLAARRGGATPPDSPSGPGRYVVAALRAACRSEAPTGRNLHARDLLRAPLLRTLTASLPGALQTATPPETTFAPGARDLARPATNNNDRPMDAFRRDAWTRDDPRLPLLPLGFGILANMCGAGA